MAKEVIRHGGAANLAETDELIGAEPYVLENVRDAATARAFLEKIENFKRYAANHGATAEGNPTGGNNFRGLYNIALKSLGAARKKAPEVRLDHVIDYGAPMREPGYYFMDSPGNDLESIAGQVAAGSNLILFITGNGSITNFPFVPTLKFVTTTGRFELLANEMDVNAGRYNDGMAMDALGAETFELALDIASGQRSKGELAGHAQVSVWRDWPRTGTDGLEEVAGQPAPEGRPLAVRAAPPLDLAFDAVVTDEGVAADQIALVMPTSLCSGQVARLIADELDANPPPWSDVSRFVALVHTEGCGSANGAGLYLDTLTGHLAHRSVRHAVLLEHGCEMTHNDAVRNHLAARGVAAERFGWASVQLDGGIASVQEKVTRQLEEMAAARAAEAPAFERRQRRLRRAPRCPCRRRPAARHHGGRPSAGSPRAWSRPALRWWCPTTKTCSATTGSGTPSSRRVPCPPPRSPSAGRRRAPGSTSWRPRRRTAVEAFAGLGADRGRPDALPHRADPAAGASHAAPGPGDPEPAPPTVYGDDLDRVFAPDGGVDAIVDALAALVADVASGRYRPALWSRGVTEFQLTRGRLGLSM